MPPKNDNIWVESQRCASSREPARLRGEVRKTKEIKQHPGADRRGDVNRVSIHILISQEFLLSNPSKLHLFTWSLPLQFYDSNEVFAASQSNTKTLLFSGAGFKASAAASSISWQSCEHDSRTMKTRIGVKKLRAALVVPWLTRFCIPIPRVHQRVRDVPVKSVSGTGRPSSARPETSWCEPSPRSIATWARLDEGCRGWSSAGPWTLRSFRKECGIITPAFGTNHYYGKFTVNPDHPWYLGSKFMILDLRYTIIHIIF